VGIDVMDIMMIKDLLSSLSRQWTAGHNFGRQAEEQGDLQSSSWELK